MTQDSHQFRMRHVYRGSDNLGLRAGEVYTFPVRRPAWLKLLAYGLAAWVIVVGPVVALGWLVARYGL